MLLPKFFNKASLHEFTLTYNKLNKWYAYLLLRQWGNIEKAPAGSGTAAAVRKKQLGGGGFLWWRGAVGKKEREWTVVGGLGDEKERGGGLGNGEGRGRCGW